MSSELKKRKVPTVEPKGPPTDMSLEENNDTQDMLQSLKAVLEQNQLQMTKMSEIDGMKERISHVGILENKCTHLEDKCTSLEKSVEVLIKHWKHSNPPTIPERNYWIDKGHDELYIDETVNDFPNDIDRNISNILKGEDTDIHMGWEDEGEILMHDVAFDAHWEKLMEALKLVNHIDNMSLFIGCIQLTPALLEILRRGLEVIKLTSIRLKNNDFVRESLEGIIRVVNTQSSMTDFIWENNFIDNIDDANLLLECIKQHPSINTIKFEDCFGENLNGYDFLCSLINGGKHFDSITLVDNNVSTMGNTHLPDYIATNPRLQTLHLENAGLNDNDATLIATALGGNNNLRELYLLKNVGITDIGTKVLRRSIFNSTSLNSVVDSNHSCEVKTTGGVYTLQNYSSAESLATDQRNNMRKKIYRMFSLRHKRGDNVKRLDAELGDDSLILVPHVLDCLYRCSENRIKFPPPSADPRPLTIFNEILKGWHMPTLFETRKRGLVGSRKQSNDL